MLVSCREKTTRAPTGRGNLGIRLRRKLSSTSTKPGGVALQADLGSVTKTKYHFLRVRGTNAGKPVRLHQDGPGWGCDLLYERGDFKPPKSAARSVSGRCEVAPNRQRRTITEREPVIIAGASCPRRRAGLMMPAEIGPAKVVP